MYYNIKIKSNGSEFSLESNNKEVTQREMDMYFAHIFDVSDDFKSQIKKIEINNANVKSIEEIENYAKNLNYQQPPVQINKIEIPQEIPTQIPTQVSTMVPSEVPTQAPRQILPEIKITSTPIQPQIQKVVVEKPNLAQNMQPLPQVSLQNSAQPIIQTIPTPAPTQAYYQIPQEQTPVQINQNANFEKLNQYNHQPTQAEIENLLNNYIENSIEPSVLNLNNPLQETPTLQNYFDSVTMPSEEIKKEYEHQKEILEIKFDNIPSFNNNESRYGYGEISTKNIEIELEEIEEIDSIRPTTYEEYQEFTTEPIAQTSEIQPQQAISEFNYNEPLIEQTAPQIEQTIPQPIYTEPKILVKSEQNFDLEQAQAPVAQNDIDELISLAQSKLDSFDMNQEAPKPQITIKKQDSQEVYETIDFDLTNSKFANQDSYKNSLVLEKEKYNINNQNKINQIFSSEEPTTTQEQQLQEKYSQTNQYQEFFQEEYEQDSTPAEIDIKNEETFNLGNIELDFEPTVQGVTQVELAKGEYREYSQEEKQQILSTPELVVPTLNIPTMQTPNMSQVSQIQPQPTQISQIAYELPTQIAQQPTQIIQELPTQSPVQEIPTQVAIQQQNAQQLSQGSYTQDFKLYLNEFNCETQSDQFLICAFYIKNILKQENFTMKSINSKLFQATGAIADLGILDDLVSKAYIRVINTPESKKYCITPDGEGYFVSRFQG